MKQSAIGKSRQLVYYLIHMSVEYEERIRRIQSNLSYDEICKFPLDRAVADSFVPSDQPVSSCTKTQPIQLDRSANTLVSNHVSMLWTIWAMDLLLGEQWS